METNKRENIITYYNYNGEVKNIAVIDADVNEITIYTSQSNIEKLKNNLKDYRKKEMDFDTRINEYEKTIR